VAGTVGAGAREEHGLTVVNALLIESRDGLPGGFVVARPRARRLCQRRQWTVRAGQP